MNQWPIQARLWLGGLKHCSIFDSYISPLPLETYPKMTQTPIQAKVGIEWATVNSSSQGSEILGSNLKAACALHFAYYDFCRIH